MNDGGRAGREVTNCVEWTIDEYDAVGGFASATTIRIETCGSDAGSSKKSTSTAHRRRRKKQQQQQQQQQHWLYGAEDDFFQNPTPRQPLSSSGGGKMRCTIKTPFASGSAGAPYNKKLRKKNMQQQQQWRPFSFGSTASERNAEVDTGSSFFISQTHRAVAEATTPWDTSAQAPGPVRYQFFGHGGLSANPPCSTRQRHRNGDDGAVDCVPSENSRGRQKKMFGGGSRVLAPLRSPSLLPPLQLLPASNADISSDVLERCLLEARLDDDNKNKSDDDDDSDFSLL